jgi:hypothetical protein
MSLDRVRVVSSGFAGANGYTNFYFNTYTSASATALRALFVALAPYIPNTVTYTFPSNGDTIDQTDGHLLGGWAVAGGAAVVGSAVASYSPATGFGIDWKPAGVIDGRRPIAKTFFVPAGGNLYTTSGGLTGSIVGVINAAVVTFLGASTGFSLWHRPVYDRSTTPPTLTRPGGAFPIVTGACAAKPFVLRSRRD